MKVFVNGVLPKGKWVWSSWQEGEYTIADGVNKKVTVRRRDGYNWCLYPVDSDSTGYWIRIGIKGYYEKV